MDLRQIKNLAVYSKLLQVHADKMKSESYANSFDTQISNMFAYVSSYMPSLSVDDAWAIITHIINN